MELVTYNKKDESITINKANFGDEAEDYINLLDELGDKDVVQINQLEQDLIAMEGNLYYLTDDSLTELANSGSITLPKVGEVRDYKKSHKEVYNWYYNV